MRQIVLLRGINLGPTNRIAMRELTERLSAAGLDDVRTYLQSGNVVLSSEESEAELAARCRQLIAERFGLDVGVIVRNRDELALVVAANPLAGVASEPKRYQVSFLEAELEAETLSELEALVRDDERLVAIGRELYAWHPKGVARSRLWAGLASPRLGVGATARNWRTVTKLLELADS
jgi:uncharacterized protein (DUF1697 family)